MTICPLFRKALFGVVGDAVIKRAKGKANYPIEHAARYKHLRKDKPPRLSAAEVVDLLTVFHPLCYMVALFNRHPSLAEYADKTQIPLQIAYNYVVWGVMQAIAKECQHIVLVVDKGVPNNKLDEVAKRMAKRTTKKRKTTEDAKDEEEEEDKWKDPGLPEAPGYIPARLYREVKSTDDVQFTFVKDQLVKYERKTGKVLNATSRVDPGSVMHNRKLRKDFIAWITGVVAQHESKRWPKVKFYLDFREDKPPMCWQNGKKLPDSELSSFTTSYWLEADHAIGAWCAAFMKAGRDVVVQTVDGDLMLICYSVMFHHRHSPQVVQERLTLAPATARSALPYMRKLAPDCENAGYLDTPKKARFDSEPKLILVLNGGSGTQALLMNVFCTILLNKGITPAHLAAMALMTKSDYVNKPDITPGIGTPVLFEEMIERVSLSETDNAEKLRRIKRFLWMCASPRLDLSPKALAECKSSAEEDAYVSTQVDAVLREYMCVKDLEPIKNPKAARHFASAWYNWWRCGIPPTVNIESLGLEPEKPLSQQSPPAAAAAASAAVEAAAAPSYASSPVYDDIDPDVLREHERMLDHDA